MDIVYIVMFIYFQINQLLEIIKQKKKQLLILYYNNFLILHGSPIKKLTMVVQAEDQI